MLQDYNFGQRSCFSNRKEKVPQQVLSFHFLNKKNFLQTQNGLQAEEQNTFLKSCSRFLVWNFKQWSVMMLSFPGHFTKDCSAYK